MYRAPLETHALGSIKEEPVRRTSHAKAADKQTKQTQKLATRIQVMCFFKITASRSHLFSLHDLI